MAMSRDEIEKMWNAMDAHLQGQPSPEPGESAASAFGLPHNSSVYPDQQERQAGGHRATGATRDGLLTCICGGEHHIQWIAGWEQGVTDAAASGKDR